MGDFTLRPATPDDAADLAVVFNQPKVIYGTLRLPFTPEQGLADWVEKLDQDSRMIVADVDGTLVGFVKLIRRRGRMAHVGSIFIAVHDAHHRKGIGRALMDAAIDVADNWMGLVRLELEVLVPNTGAIALYEACGFQIEGRARAGTLADGVLVDHFIMARLRASPERRAEDVAASP